MKYSVFISVVLFTLFFASCKKEDSNPIISEKLQEQVTDYYPLSVGSYWIYESYFTDSNLVLNGKKFIDSVYIEKDSIYNGIKYKVFKSTHWYTTSLVRDSLNYIVNNAGKKIFSLNNNSEILREEYYLNDSSFVLRWKMKTGDTTFSCPSGDYISKLVVGKLTKFKAKSAKYNERNLFMAYTKNIGRVAFRSCYVIQGDYLEKKLLRYKVVTE